MSHLFFDLALLPTGWAEHVRAEVTDSGAFASVTVGATPEGATHVSGAVVPGVPNLHSHAFQRAMAGLAERGSADGDTFWSWRELMYGFLGRVQPEHVEVIAAQLQVELLRHGYTAVAEFHYLRNDLNGRPYATATEMAMRVHAAAVSSGIGLTLLPVLYRTSDFGGRPPTQGQLRFITSIEGLLTDVSTLRSATVSNLNRRVGMALHSLRAVPPDDLHLAVTALGAIDASAPIHIHVAEQRREVEACVAWSGARPVEWLLNNVPVDRRWCAVHATHMTVEETMGLAGTGAVAGLCPTTEANLGDGIFPFADYLASGGVWGVGTDSHVSVSPVAELRMLEYGQRLVTHERNVAAGPNDRSTGRTLLEGAWAGGAQACGRPIGVIEEGARADIVVLDTGHPALVGRRGDEILDAWVFSGEDTPVRDVMVGGDWVVRDGRHRNQAEIAEAYAKVARAISQT